MPYNQTLNRAAFAMMTIALMAFGTAARNAIQESTECFLKYDPVFSAFGNLAIGLDACEDGECTLSCVTDMSWTGGSGGQWTAVIWCECGGTKDGVNSNTNCHGVATYKATEAEDDLLDFKFQSYICQLPCTDGTSCIKLEPPGGFTPGQKLCGCD